MKKPKPLRVKIGKDLIVSEGLCGLVSIQQRWGRDNWVELAISVEQAKELSNAVYDCSEAIYQNGARL